MMPLDRNEAFAKIRSMFSSSKSVVVAAPYFGKGASEALGLHQSSAEIEIVCDLFSGGCNPKEIRRIAMLQTKPLIKRLAGLHAKVYLTEREVVIGSANPSSNGLGFEGDELRGNIEACVHSDDPQVVAAWRNFYESAIRSKASTVTSEDITLAIPLYELRRGNRRRSDQTSLVGELISNRENFKDKPFYIMLHDSVDFDEHEKEVLHQAREQLKIEGLDGWGESCFHDVEPRPGSFVLDFYVYRRRVHSLGVWVTTSPVCRAEEIVLAVEQDTMDGLAVTEGEKKYLAKLIETRLAQVDSFCESMYEWASIVQQHPPGSL